MDSCFRRNDTLVLAPGKSQICFIRLKCSQFFKEPAPLRSQNPSFGGLFPHRWELPLFSPTGTVLTPKKWVRVAGETLSAKRESENRAKIPPNEKDFDPLIPREICFQLTVLLRINFPSLWGTTDVCPLPLVGGRPVETFKQTFAKSNILAE